MSSAAEARFRIDAPNSRPRVVKVIALDTPSEAVVKRVADACLAARDLLHVARSIGRRAAATGWTMQAWLTDLAGRTKALIDEVASADLVVMVASAGDEPAGGRRSSARPAVRKVMTTSLIIGSEHASDEVLSKTLAQLRPYSSMLVIADADDYIDDMLAALRA